MKPKATVYEGYIVSTDVIIHDEESNQDGAGACLIIIVAFFLFCFFMVQYAAPFIRAFLGVE